MTDVKSKNLYELLGNSHDQDSDQEPEPPVKTVDKPNTRVGKRDAPPVEKVDAAAAAPRRNNERREGGFNGDERKFRDRTNRKNQPEGYTPNNNRDHPIENTDGTVRGRDSGPGTQRAGRGRGGQRRGGDRHFNRSGRQEHEKQTEQAWGKETGEGEQEDEKAGEALAQEDKKEAIAEEVAPEPIPEAEPEPEDTNISYADYLAQQAAKKLEGLGLKEARAANEGAKDNKKWKNATALSKDEKEEEAYFVGEAKAKRERERVQKKQVLDIDYAFKEQSRPERGGRGGGRGGRGRGDRSDRGDRGEGRGEGRGGRGGEYRPRGDRGDRGTYRGGRGRSENQQPVSTTDESAFPALGGK